jgi:hypothetical protein
MERPQRRAFINDGLHCFGSPAFERVLQIEKVRVRIDQAGEYRIGSQIDFSCPCRNREILSDRLDALVFDDDISVSDEGSLLTVENPSGMEYGRPGIGWSLSYRARRQAYRENKQQECRANA